MLHGLCFGEEAGARNLVFFRVKWLQPAMKGTSAVRRLRLRGFGSFYVFCNNGCSCVRSSMRFLKPWLQIALERLHECCMLCVVGKKPEHETLWFFPTLTCGVFVFSSASAASPVRPPALTLSLSHSLSLTLTHSLTHSLTHTHSLTRSPPPPLSASLRGRRGTMCTVKGSDVRPGVPLASLGLRLFCVAGVGQCALSRGFSPH